MEDQYSECVLILIPPDSQRLAQPVYDSSTTHQQARKLFRVRRKVQNRINNSKKFKI